MKNEKTKNLLNILSVTFLFCSIISCKKDNTGAGTGNGNGGPTSPPANAAASYRDALGNGMDVDWAKTSQGMQYYNLQSVIDFKARGFKHVRIRVANDLTPALLDFMERVVTDCISKDLIPVLAYQADAFKNNPTSQTEIDNAANWWKSVAERFKNYSPKLSFDLLIECTDGLNSYPDKLNQYFEKAVTQIRATNPTRILMISPIVRSDPDNLKLLVIPTQANGYIMAEWHFYASGPSKTNANKLWTTGTAAEKKLITDAIDTAFAWQTRTGIPTWVGAWMPGDYNDGDNYTVQEQIVFATFMSCSLRKKLIPYAVNSDTKFYDRTNNTWVGNISPVVDAFLNPVCP